MSGGLEKQTGNYANSMVTSIRHIMVPLYRVKWNTPDC